MRFPHWFDELPERGFLLAKRGQAQGGTAIKGPCKFSRFSRGFARVFSYLNKEHKGMDKKTKILMSMWLVCAIGLLIWLAINWPLPPENIRFVYQPGMIGW